MSAPSVPALLPGASAGVLGLDSAATLRLLTEEQRREDQAAAHKLACVAHWADLHRTGDDGVVDPVYRSAGRVLDGLEGDLALGGAGVFLVEEFSVCEIATALGLSEPSARRLVGETLELRERLPRCWGRIMAGDLPAWKGRQIAAETILLNAAAAAYVDAHLAPFAARMSLRRILRAVHAAIIRHDPALAAERAAAAAESRGVWRTDDPEGTSTLTVVTDTPDAAAFDSTLDDVATALASLGDSRPAQVRRATAVGILADPQAAFALLDRSTGDADDVPSTRPVHRGPVFHIHLHHDAITGTGPGVRGAVARIPTLGARSLEAVRLWLSALGTDATVHLTPVIDLDDHISVDSYEVPDRLRRQVEARDPGCVFPWCRREGRFDVDHIDPFRSPDSGGPPGQTSTVNTARLCRFHHRVKTFSAWTYRRAGPTQLIWTSPHGRHYAVDEHGTTARR